jgi:hypothetical protein
MARRTGRCHVHVTEDLPADGGNAAGDEVFRRSPLRSPGEPFRAVVGAGGGPADRRAACMPMASLGMRHDGLEVLPVLPPLRSRSRPSPDARRGGRSALGAGAPRRRRTGPSP